MTGKEAIALVSQRRLCEASHGTRQKMLVQERPGRWKGRSWSPKQGGKGLPCRAEARSPHQSSSLAGFGETSSPEASGRLFL